MLKFEESARIIAAESQYVSGGVNSNFRLGMSPGPLVFTHGEGAYLHDVDGNKLIDYYCGMGAMVLGHTPPGVQAAVKSQVDKGILFAGQAPIEYEAARIICERIPSAERLRFGSSGSEVAQAAMRVSRAATGRQTIVKFEGHYHGWFDNVLWSTAPALADAGPADAPVLVAGSKGQARADGDGLDVLQWNDLAAVEARLARGDVAAIMMEAAMCNQGAIAPMPGYLEGVQAACRKHGTILIFDEVITGFRLGASGAQGRFNVTPDLSIFAKAIANGFPVAAIVGRADLMDMFSTGGVLHGGTFNSQPVAMAAMVATQQGLTPEHYERTSVYGVRLRDGIRDILAQAGIKAQVTGFELMFHVAFGLDAPARNYRDLTKADKAGYSRFSQALLQHGVRVLERGAWFVSSEHNDAVVDKTLEAVRAAAKDVAPSLAT
ncbi:aspartate aminotransferase family protein [Devosia neptuniae]|jgi:glutamate-1-semialdehyde 2,1-aminomutase|uniref:aspartate aminotransferase family protein n=1 Tax=Devosia neptuniae TaxID=191302 RepID=UPI0022AFA8D7|nr:aspartate aminotransferase family protein [Devosia neptuniae]MCZ4345554.1 aspartate aminotransferase family protein [Devosia neptuniae]|tara:strand:+ start:16125 stop:17429 length:1305 start_codon:yes stop_codon:yes gene_type:complete